MTRTPRRAHVWDPSPNVCDSAPLEHGGDASTRRERTIFILWILGYVALAATAISGFLYVGSSSAAHLEQLAANDAREEQLLGASHQVWTTTSTTPIWALGSSTQTDSTLDGGIFVATSTSSSEPSIRYTERLEDGGIVLREIPAESSVVYETDVDSDDLALQNTDPRIETQTCWLEAASPEAQREIEALLEGRYSDPRDCGTRSAIYVPTGSISTDSALKP